MKWKDVRKRSKAKKKGKGTARIAQLNDEDVF